MIQEFKLSEPLPFILKDGLTSGHVEEHKGLYKVTSGDFKQLIKKSQYDQLMAANILSKSVAEEEEESEEQTGNGDSGNSEGEQDETKPKGKLNNKGAGTRRK